MNRNQLISLGVALVIIIVVFLGYGQRINSLQINPKIGAFSGMEFRRTSEIETAENERSRIVTGIIVVSMVVLFLLKDKKEGTKTKTLNDYVTSKEQKESHQTQQPQQNNIMEKEKIIASLLNLKEEGILTEEEFLDKVSRL